MFSGIFFFFVLDDEVVLVLCVVNWLVLIFVDLSLDLVYLEIVFLEIFLCGCMMLINSFFFVFFRGFVFLRYFFSVRRG